MEKLGAISVCVLLLAAVLPAFIKGKPVFGLFTEGAKDGLNTAVQLLPTLVGMITAVAMLRASGLFDLFTRALTPWLEKTGVHADLIPLMLLRPFSGSGSAAYVTELYARHGADAAVSRMAAVLSSATETTFYAAAVYFAGRRYKSILYTVPAALCGDLAASVLAVLAVHLFG